MKTYEHGIDALKAALKLSKNENIYLQLGKIHALKEDFKSAIEIYKEALKYSIESQEIMTILGLLYLKMGDTRQAFQYLGNALAIDAKAPKAILAVGSIMQDRFDYDAALLKYKLIAGNHTNSAQLWNNIGMCFYGKKKFIAAVTCLKRALYLDPFEWLISYNLGLVHLSIQQYASAFHFFSVAINLKPNFANSYMYMGIALNKLDDFDNACSAFERALQVEKLYYFLINSLKKIIWLETISYTSTIALCLLPEAN